MIRRGKRVLWLSVLSVLALMGLGVRVYGLQVTRGPEYAKMAFRQRTQSVPVRGWGHVVDRHGVPLSDPRPLWGVAVFPVLVREREATATALAPVVGSREAVLEALGRGYAGWLVRGVSAVTASRVQALGLPGIAVSRVEDGYGDGAAARHLVGYHNQAGGQLGLERAYERYLHGEAVPALMAYLDGKGRPLAGQPIRTMLPAAGQEPARVETTIHIALQQVVDEALDELTARKAAVVLMDPQSGDVLAMASRPQFDYSAIEAALRDPGAMRPLFNRVVTAFAPGSVFKPMIAAAALEAGKADLDETITCTGSYRIGNHVFHDADAKAHGKITLRDAIARSCNVAFLQVGYERLGLGAMREAALRFGFGSATGGLGAGVTWAEEQVGRVPGAKDGGLIQLAFGQGGLETTPLQVARAYAAIANGGLLPPVRLVTAVRNPAGEVVYRPPAGQAQRILSEAVAGAMRAALVGVTDPRGKGTARGTAWVEPGGAAGKTGSAEGRDLAGRPAVHAWFAGFFPADSPRYVAVVFVEGGGSGAAAAAPLFGRVATAVLRATGSY